MKEENKIDQVFKKLAKAEEKNSFAKESIWNKIEEGLEVEKPNRFSLNIPKLSIAASLVIIFSLAGIYLFTENKSETNDKPMVIMEKNTENAMQESNAATSMVQADAVENSAEMSNEEQAEILLLEEERKRISSNSSYAYEDISKKNKQLEERISKVESRLNNVMDENKTSASLYKLEQNEKKDLSGDLISNDIGGLKITGNLPTEEPKAIAPISDIGYAELSNNADKKMKEKEMFLETSKSKNNANVWSEGRSIATRQDSIFIDWKKVNVKKLNAQELKNYKSQLKNLDTLKLSTQELKIYHIKSNQLKNLK